MNIRTDSVEYIYSTVTADHDITGKNIEVALPLTGVGPTSWYAATVESVQQTSASPPRWQATYKLLIGPGTTVGQLAVGTYDWTFRLTDTPEKPVRKTGSVQVTLI